MNKHIRLIAMMGLVLALMAGASLASALGEGGVIRACVNNSSGNARIVAAGLGCQKHETLLQWNALGSGGEGDANSTVFAIRGLVVLYGGGVCTNFLGDNNACNATFDDFNTPMPRAGRLATLAIRPFFNTLSAPATVTVYVNNAPTALSATIPAGSTATVILEGSVSVAAGDLVKIVGTGPNAPVSDERLDYNGTLVYEYP